MLKSGHFLDGLSFTGEVGPVNRSEKDEEMVAFRDGKFRSKALSPYGFKDAPYTSVIERNANEAERIGFEADVSNGKGEVMSWKGFVQDEIMQGTAIHIKDGREQNRYWFRCWLNETGVTRKSAA